jgi:transposase
MKKFIVIQKRPYGATQVSLAHHEGERSARSQKRIQLGILDADGNLMLKQGFSLDAATRRLLKAKGIAISEQGSPGRGRPKGIGTKTKQKAVAKALGTGTGTIAVLDAQGTEGWDVRETGRTAALEKLAADSGLTTCLDTAFGEERASTLLARSIFHVSEGEAPYLAEAWQEEVTLSRDPGPLDSGSISHFERGLGNDAASRHAFMSAWIEQLDRPSSLILDSTSHSTEAKQIVDAEFGYNRDGERMAQVNLTMVLDRAHHLPIYYRTLPGSIPDVSSLSNTSELLRQLGLKDFNFILDRGFHSHDNLVEMILAKQGFTVGVPLTGKQAQGFVAEHRPSLENSKNSFLISGSLVYGAKHSWTLEDDRLPEGKTELDGWLFFDPERAQGQRKTIETKMIEFEGLAAAKTFTSEAGAKKWLAEQAKGWTEYLEVEQLPDAPAPEKAPRKNAKSPQLQRFRVGRNHAAIEAQRPCLGITFVLATMAHPDALNALLDYRARDTLEKMFRCDKSVLDNLRMRVHSTATMHGRLFVNFISLILATLFENRLRERGLLDKMSMAEALQQLRKVRRIDIPGQPSVMLEISKKAAAILAACGIGEATATKPARKPAGRRK